MQNNACIFYRTRKGCAVEKQYITSCEEETEALGRQLAAQLRPGDTVALFGGLGAGKTAFVRGLAGGLGCGGYVSSPTYALVNEYDGPVPLAHFDMYRVSSWEELESTGYYDYLDDRYILAVEWSENVRAALPKDAWHVTIAPGEGENSRAITIKQGDNA